MKIKTVLIFLISTLLISCKTTNEITYFQDIDKLQMEQISTQPVKYDAKICPDDELDISVSSIDPDAVLAFNLKKTSYLVDSNGLIDFPVLGKISVLNKTRRELTDLLIDKISMYVKNPIVTIRIINFKIAVLGEVNRPGNIIVPNERISILDAISMAGDLSISGERSNIMLIREKNGKKEVYRFDLTSSEVLSSPFYYLQQNDILYVEPNKAKRGSAKYSQSNQFNISVASTIVGGFSVIASLAIALLVK